MTWNRRELLGSLGVTSASTLLWAFGCRAPAGAVHAPRQTSDEIRGWLRDAVARIATRYPTVRALAMNHRRTTAALDVLGTGVASGRRDGVVFSVRDAQGTWHEHVTELTEAGIRATTTTLVGTAAPAPIRFPAAPAAVAELPRINERALRDQVAAIAQRDRVVSSRIVYAAALIDIDDVTLWAIAPGQDLEHRVRRVRKRATRAAWSGTRPIVSEVERGWSGGLDDFDLDEADVSAASKKALMLMTPGPFPDGEATVLLEPGVTATIIDAAVRGLLTSAAARRPEVARRLQLGATAIAPALTLIDDPTAAGAYGGFAFDDDGTPAAPLTLVDAGRVVGRLADRAAVDTGRATIGGRGRRPGHLGVVRPLPSHLQLATGTDTVDQLTTEGWLLEGRVGARFDSSSDRIVVTIARARELRSGSATGRVFADIELVGELAVLLAGVTGIGDRAESTIARTDVDGLPCWTSIAAPYLRTRGLVRARRRVT